MNSGVTVFFIFKALSGLMGLWPRKGKGITLGFIQSGLSSLHQYGQLVSFETSQSIQSILKKITGLP